jgi:hypothetical protein
MCFFLDNEHDGEQLNLFNNNMRISIFTDQKKYGTKTHIAQFIVGKSGKNVTTTRVTLQIHKYQEERLNMKKIEKHTTGACGIIVHRPSDSIPNTSGKRLIDRCFTSGAYYSICSTSIY